MKILTKKEQKALITLTRKILKGYSTRTRKPSIPTSGICNNLCSELSSYLKAYNIFNGSMYIVNVGPTLHRKNPKYYCNYELYPILHPTLDAADAYWCKKDMWKLSGPGIDKDTKEYNKRRRLAAAILSKSSIEIKQLDPFAIRVVFK